MLTTISIWGNRMCYKTARGKLNLRCKVTKALDVKTYPNKKIRFSEEFQKLRAI